MSFDEVMQEILETFYKPEAIYLQRIMAYVPENKYLSGVFYVPLLPSYSVQPINYVTAEQYVRCLSQLSYVLVGMLIKHEILQFGTADYAAFKQLVADCKLYFLRTDLSYRQKVLRDEPFGLKLTLIAQGSLRQLHTCTLKVEGVVRGELELCGG